MADESRARPDAATGPEADGGAPQGQAAQQTGRREVGLRIDESKLTTSYTNAFRSNVTAEEVVLDFGMNLTQPVPQQGNGEQGRVANITFQINNRLVMNYYTAKRLAMLLSNVVRQYEQQFGELKLNAADRQTAGGQS
jgi:hypothetical protein